MSAASDTTSTSVARAHPPAEGEDAARVTSIVDDSALMLRYRNGDLRAFEMLYARHKTSLYRYLVRMCRDGDAANDVFQEVWGKVIASRERYEVRAQFATFLYRIAHNCSIDYHRRSVRLHAGSTQAEDNLIAEIPGSPQSQPDESVASMQVQAQFRQALDALPPEQRDVFVLYEETGLSLEEIGKVTGVAMETAKSRLRYAVAKLRAALQQHQIVGAST